MLQCPGMALRILLVVHDFLPRHRAGVEVYTYRLARALRAMGHRVRVLCAEHRPDRPAQSIIDDTYEGLPVTRVVTHHLYRDFTETYRHPAMEARFAEVLARERPDVVHLQHLLYWSVGVVDRAQARGVPVVWTLHDYWAQCTDLAGGLRYPFFQDAVCDPVDEGLCVRCVRHRLHLATPATGWLYRIARWPVVRTVKGWPGIRTLALWWLQATGRLPAPEAGGISDADLAAQIRERNRATLAALRRADRLISPSAFLREQMLRFGVDPARILHLDNGQDLSVFAAVPRSRPPQRPLRFGYVGTPARHKGVHLLVEAFQAVDPAAATLHVHGDLGIFPEYGAELRRRAADRPHVHFPGPFAPARVAQVYADLDVLVLPSLWYENSPLTIHEAHRSGLPVICARTGGMPERVRDGESGYTFTPGDVADLRRAIQRFLEEPAAVERMRATFPASTPMPEHARQLVALYREVGAGSGDAGGGEA